MEVLDIVPEAVTKTILEEKEMKKWQNGCLRRPYK